MTINQLSIAIKLYELNEISVQKLKKKGMFVNVIVN